MPQTYTPIATYTTSGTSTTYTFSSIPSTYTDLVLVMALIGTGDGQIRLRFNGDTGSNYSNTILNGNGTTAASARVTGSNVMQTDYTFSMTTAGGMIKANIMNYSNSTTTKTVLTRSDNAGKGTTATVGLWNNTSAINSTTIIADFASFASGTVFTLYGIKAA